MGANASSRDGAAGGRAVPVAALRRLARERAPAVRERCELCGNTIPAEHRHLLDRSSRALLCACHACAVLFERDGAGDGRYLTVPRRYVALADFALSDAQWDELMIPVGMAFIYPSGAARRPVAYYPGPAGATESLLSLDYWQALVAANPALAGIAPDVEALLVNRTRAAREYYIVPIDACYQLVGIIRGAWRGLSGGEAVWKAVAAFFDELRAKAGASVGNEAAKGARHA